MYLVECLEKIYKEKSNLIVGYKIANINTGEIMQVEKENLKSLIRDNKVTCINMQLTPHNKLVGRKKVENSNVMSYYRYLIKCRALGIPQTMECVINIETDKVALVKIQRVIGNVITIPSFITDILYEPQRWPFWGGPLAYADNAGYVKVINNSKQIKSLYGLFAGFRAEVLDLTEMDTSNVWNMHSMFEHASVSQIKFGGKFNTSKVVDMSRMFRSSLISEIDISMLNTSKVIDMSQMFLDCTYLKKLNIKGINTRNVKNFSEMFKQCTALETVDIAHFNTSKAENMSMMFMEAGIRGRVDLSNFDMTNVKTTFLMFSGTKNITEIIMPYSKVSQLMQSSCWIYKTMVQSIDLGGIEPEYLVVTNTNANANVIAECKELKSVTIHGKNLWDKRVDLVKCINSIVNLSSIPRSTKLTLRLEEQYSYKKELIEFIRKNSIGIGKIEFSK